MSKTTAPEPVGAKTAAPRTRPSRRLVAGLAAGVVAIAIGGYAVTGSPRLATPGGAPDAGVAAGESASAVASRAESIRQIEQMVGGLATRLKDNPDDAQGWFMLARSYTVLGRFAESLPAYGRAAQLQPGNAALLADWADATAAVRNSVTHPDVVALIERALAADPTQPKALALAGTVDFDRGDFDAAARRWQQLADRLPADSDLRKQVDASIAEARGKAGGGTMAAAPARPSPDGTNAAAATATAPVAPSASTVAAATAPGGMPGPAAAGKAVGGTVVLAPALAGSVVPGDSVFVFARAASGPRMPLAVRRATVADLPLTFKLDDSMAMTPAMTLSRADRVIVGARISKSGNATPQPGDLAGESAEVAPGATGLQITIDRVVR